MRVVNVADVLTQAGACKAHDVRCPQAVFGYDLCMYIRVCMCMYVYIYIYHNIYTYITMYIYLYTHVYIHTYIYTHTYIHTYIYACKAHDVGGPQAVFGGYLVAWARVLVMHAYSACYRML